MSFAVKCPTCSKTLKVEARLGGQGVTCPGCKNKFVCPEAPAPAKEVGVADAPPVPGSKEPEPEPEPSKPEGWYASVAAAYNADVAGEDARARERAEEWEEWEPETNIPKLLRHIRTLLMVIIALLVLPYIISLVVYANAQ